MNFGLQSLPDIAAWSLIRILEFVENRRKIGFDLISGQDRSSFSRVAVELYCEKHVPEKRGTSEIDYRMQLKAAKKRKQSQVFIL